MSLKLASPTFLEQITFGGFSAGAVQSPHVCVAATYNASTPLKRNPHMTDSVTLRYWQCRTPQIE